MTINLLTPFIMEMSSEHLPRENIGSPDILCGNVTKFSMAKNDYAHRNLHTRISLELNFYVSSSFNFRDFSV